MGNDFKLASGSHVEEKDDFGFLKMTPQEVVKQKIKNSSYYHKKFQSNIDEISTLLSDKQKLLDSYLCTDWLVTQQLQKRMADWVDEVDEEELSGGVESPRSEEQVEIEVLDRYASMEDIQKMKMNPDYQLGHSVRIKFIVSEILRLRKRPLKKFYYFNVVTPYLNVMNTLPDFGIYHIALQVGPWIIELNSSGLCVPRKLSSQAALLSADVREIASREDVLKTIDKMADVIIKWNTRIHYTKHRGNLKDKEGIIRGNCQEFLMELLGELDIDLNQVLRGPMKRYVKKIIHDGHAKLDFIGNKAFKKKFGTKHRTVSFNSHEQLDRFVLKCFEKDHMFQANHPDEYHMLKSFDRAIWLKHIRHPHKPEFAPLREKDDDDDEQDDDDESDSSDDEEKRPKSPIMKLLCPFNDPRVTKSFLFPKLKTDHLPSDSDTKDELKKKEEKDEVEDEGEEEEESSSSSSSSEGEEEKDDE